jgi:superfamily I DNA and/or RNA helicase
VEQLLGIRDILIIAPYNAQVFDLREKMPGAKIGTVDKFQGEEALIEIYFMTTSMHADAPRGTNFQYSLNRVSVATPRAKITDRFVRSPAQFKSECRVPNQMRAERK